MGHWQLLSLEPGADERSIKRAYAKLLKIHRPDEHPAEFQRLREAYEAALAHARWRAEAHDEITDTPPPAPSNPAPLDAPSALRPAAWPAAWSAAIPEPVKPPEPSLVQMQQWLADGRDREVMDALRVWLVSDWLLPFERRAQFEQRVLEWIESTSHTPHVFFEGVCQALGWDEAQGNLPCERWRWNRLVHRCEAQALADRIRAELARFDATKVEGQAAALLFKSLPETRRRAMADSFSALEWQRFTELAQAVEYRYPDVPRQLGLQPLDNWRDWLPADDYHGVYLFLWFALSGLLYALMSMTRTMDMTSGVLMPILVLLALGIGNKVYKVWGLIAAALLTLDITLSKSLLAQRWYRQGAGLLVIRHILPSVAPATLAAIWSVGVLWLQWSSTIVVFLGTIYFTNTALMGGRVSLWVRGLRAIQRGFARLPMRWLSKQQVIIALGVGLMAAIVVWRMHGL